MPALARLIVEHRPERLAGQTLRDALVLDALRPEQLVRTYARWRAAPRRGADLRPCVLLAALGQARVCGRLSAGEESRVLEQLLSHWALRRVRNRTKACTRPAA